MTNSPPSPLPGATNIDRLLGHLKPDSLAARLVAAYAGVKQGKHPDAMAVIIKERLGEIARGYDHAENQKN